MSAVKAWKSKLDTAELRLRAAEVAQLQNEAECWRLAKQVYQTILRLDRRLKQIQNRASPTATILPNHHTRNPGTNGESDVLSIDPHPPGKARP